MECSHHRVFHPVDVSPTLTKTKASVSTPAPYQTAWLSAGPSKPLPSTARREANNGFLQRPLSSDEEEEEEEEEIIGKGKGKGRAWATRSLKAGGKKSVSVCRCYFLSTNAELKIHLS